MDGLLVRIGFVQHIDRKHLVERLLLLVEVSSLSAERPFCDLLGVCWMRYLHCHLMQLARSLWMLEKEAQIGDERGSVCME